MTLRVGIAGLGTVGAGVAQILRAKGKALTARSGRNIAIAAVCARDRKKDRGVDLSDVAWEKDARNLISRDDVDVIVELIGGTDGIALDLVEGALRAGKHVVTANKALLARHGAALAVLAEEANVSLKFEAAICGGIPAL